jgi:[acyl-carrier-protein] S-malonyltransferase
VPLDVAGAFHTTLMQGARDALSVTLENAPFTDPRMPVVSNVSGKPMASAAEFPGELSEQVTSPVLWVHSVRTMLDGGVTSFVEFGPGRVLTGLVRRTERSARVRNVETAENARSGSPE